MKENYYNRNIRAKPKIKADSNQGRSFVPMVVSAASEFIFWRCFVFKTASNRFKTRQTAPNGLYYPIVVKMKSSVSGLKNILPVLKNYSSSESTANKENPKPWYHFLSSGGIVKKRNGNFH
jgi:hypothetical protein